MLVVMWVGRIRLGKMALHQAGISHFEVAFRVLGISSIDTEPGLASAFVG